MVRKRIKLTMRKHLTYLFIASVLMNGCDKYNDVQSSASGEDYITLKLDVATTTKSLINPDAQTLNFNTIGSKIILYDVFTAGDGQTSAELTQYLDEQNLLYDGLDWIFTKSQSNNEEVKIPWTKTGGHDFFAHNSYDAASGLEIPYEVGYSSFEDNAVANTIGKHQYFQVPASGTLQMTTHDNQFDFLYSSHYRDIAIDGFKPVEMDFKHLFAAVYFEVKNISSSVMKLNSFSLGGIKDIGSAKIAYNGDVALTLSASSQSSLFAETPNRQLKVGEAEIIYDDCGAGKAILIWPHSAANFANASFTLKYNLARNSSATSWYSENVATVPLSGAESPYKVNNWAAGTVYKYNITVSDNNISLSVTRVVDWINDDVILEE